MSKQRARITLSFLGVLGLLCDAAVAAPMYAVEYPGSNPGPATVALNEKQITLSNQALTVTWHTGEPALRIDSVADRNSNSTARGGQAALFAIELADGRRLESTDFRLDDAPVQTQLAADPSARRLAERFGGWQVRVPLTTADGSIKAVWTMTLRDESNYVIQELTLSSPAEDLALDKLILIDFDADKAELAGTTQGAPVTAGTLFFAYEHPMAENRAEDGHVTCRLKRGTVLKAGAALEQTAVIGVTPEGQRRRGFLYYLERERAHPYRPFLHYNSWYDISWGDRKFD